MPRMPSKIETKIDKYLEAQIEVKRLDAALKRTTEYKNLEKAKQWEEEVKQSLIGNHAVEVLKGTKGRKAFLTVTERINYKINDFNALVRFVVRRKAWDIFQKRITPTAVQEREADGVEVPGVEKYFHISINAKSL